MFKTQFEIWLWLIEGNSIFQNGVEIKFVDNVIKARMGINKEWCFCPIAFENPKLFIK